MLAADWRKLLAHHSQLGVLCEWQFSGTRRGRRQGPLMATCLLYVRSWACSLHNVFLHLTSLSPCNIYYKYKELTG